MDDEPKLPRTPYTHLVDSDETQPILHRPTSPAPPKHDGVNPPNNPLYTNSQNDPKDFKGDVYKRKSTDYYNENTEATDDEESDEEEGEPEPRVKRITLGYAMQRWKEAFISSLSNRYLFANIVYLVGLCFFHLVFVLMIICIEKSTISIFWSYFLLY